MTHTLNYLLSKAACTFFLGEFVADELLCLSIGRPGTNVVYVFAMFNLSCPMRRVPCLTGSFWPTIRKIETSFSDSRLFTRNSYSGSRYKISVLWNYGDPLYTADCHGLLTPVTRRL